MSSEILADLFASIALKGLTLDDVAAAADISSATLSCARRQGTMDLEKVERLAGAAGFRIQLVAAGDELTNGTGRTPIDALEWGLRRANPSASTRAVVRAVLRRGLFSEVLGAVIAHGIELVRAQFQELAVTRQNSDPELLAAETENLHRMLGNIELGIRSADDDSQ